jgi:hypothetical protein
MSCASLAHERLCEEVTFYLLAFCSRRLNDVTATLPKTLPGTARTSPRKLRSDLSHRLGAYSERTHRQTDGTALRFRYKIQKLFGNGLTYNFCLIELLGLLLSSCLFALEVTTINQEAGNFFPIYDNEETQKN